MAKPKAERVEIESRRIDDRVESIKTKVVKIKPKLSETEQKVLEYISALDHPANTNEVRDKFGFPLRANARRIFRKLEKLGSGENRKVDKRYLFYVKGKEYPEPKTEEIKKRKVS